MRYVFVRKPKSVGVGSKGQYTALGDEVHVPKTTLG